MAESSKSTWHNRSSEDILTEFKVDRKTGLTSEQYFEYFTRYGPNSLPAKKSDTLLIIFLRQFKSPLIYLLMAAAGLMIVVGEVKDAYIIGAVLLFNAIAGTIQAGRAQNTLKALEKMSKTNATVIRNGEEVVIDDTEVVPGDIIKLAEGDKVPAGARLIESKNLRINESALTGESQPIGKHDDIVLHEKLQISDQKNMVFKGTFVVAGSATAVVTATGINTVMGKISQQILDIDTEIPLQKQIARLSHIIIYVVLLIAVLIFTLGWLTGKEAETMFTLAVAVIVSAVPEGLPIVLTLLMATGVWRMSKRNVLVKRLQAVEALGEAKIIAVDKTGTITKNELSLTAAYISGKSYTISGVGYEPVGTVNYAGSIVSEIPLDLHWLATVASLCSTARVHYNKEDALYEVHGDPTEAAMTVFGQKLGLTKQSLNTQFSQKDEIPFDSSLRYHALTIQESEKPIQLLVAGAAEQLLGLATYIHYNGTIVPLTDSLRAEVSDVISNLSGQALRVIGFAEKTNFTDSLSSDSVHNLTLIGLVGMQDGLRSEVPDAMLRTQEAGVKVVMITGDHKETARAIAAEAGIFNEGDTILTNDEIEAMTEEEFIASLATTTVFARITPDYKLKIVQAFQKRGDIVAMTGDGVNDALSLVAADLGVAMGKRGTEVAKEAADLILLDDNFGSIVSAIEEGRRIYVNTQKVILYLFSTSVGEVIVVLGALALLLPAPVLAAQLIWINLVTDGFLDIALAMEPKEKSLMQQKINRIKTKLINGWMIQRLLIKSSIMGIGTLILFIMYLDQGLPYAMSVAVTVLVVAQWFKVWTNRSQYHSVFSINVFGNMYLVYALVLVMSLHFFALYNPFMQNLLSLQPVGLDVWCWAILIGVLIVAGDELRKFVFWKFEVPRKHTDILQQL
jgi:P-type Ca2+ transporter type 2C